MRITLACLAFTFFCLPAAFAQGEVEVVSIEVGSGKEYVVGEEGLDVGVKYYIDRDYTVTEMPEDPNGEFDLVGATFIMTANDDKNGAGEDFLKIEVAGPTVVWVAHDSRGEEEKGGTPAAWLSEDEGWTKHPEMMLTVTDGGMGFFIMWSKEFDAGEAVLGGNADPPAGGHGSNYLVVLTPGTPSPVESQDKLATTWGTLRAN